MGIYIGIIEKKGYEPTVFFNFKPIDYSGRLAHALKRVQRMGIAV